MMIKMKYEISNKIFDQKFVLDYERRMSFQKIRLFDYAIQFDIPLLLDIDLGLQLYRIKDGIVTHWVEKNMSHKLHEKAYQFFKDPKSKDQVDKLINYIETSLSKLTNLSEFIPNYSTFLDEELRSAYVEFCKIEKEISFMNQLLFIYFENAITDALKFLLNGQEIEQLEDLSLQTETIPLDVYYLDICSYLANEINIEELYSKYVHFGMVDVIDKSLSKEKLNNDIEMIKIKDPSLFKKEIEAKYIKNRLKVKNVFSKIEAETHLYSLIKYYYTYSNKKEWKNFIREKSSYKLSKLLSEIAQRRSLTLKDLSYLKEEEICQIITKNNSNLENIKRRTENSIYIIYQNHIEVIDEKKLLDNIDLFLSNKDQDIKGDVACNGKIQGRVCIILSNQDFYKFKEGDIIVTPTTRPDYVPLMGKCSAIVTNEGGILSHAAILSREFNKPCIIGTRIATTVLNDGDLIEVDAFNGIVTKK